MLVGDFTPLHFGHLGSISATLDRLIEGLISWRGKTDTFTTPHQFSIDQTFGLLYWSLIYLANAFDHQWPEALIDQRQTIGGIAFMAMTWNETEQTIAFRGGSPSEISYPVPVRASCHSAICDRFPTQRRLDDLPSSHRFSHLFFRLKPLSDIGYLLLIVTD